MSLTISYREDRDPVTVVTTTELDTELDRIAAEAAHTPEAPLLVALEVPGTQRTMLVGQRGSVGVLNYVDLAGTAGGFISRADRTGQPTPPYFYFGSWTGIDPDAEIPVDQVRAAARELLSTGRQPGCVEWQ